jgi:hypothetical protein
VHGIRFTDQDRKVVTALRDKLGVKNISDLIRMALRALATKEGVTL